MLRVSYLTKYGYFLMLANDGKTYLKVDLHPANCDAFAMIYHYKQKNEETGKNQKMAQLVGFFSDLKHFKKCFNDDPIYTTTALKKAVFYSNLKNFEKYAKYMTLAGFNVSIKKAPKSAQRKEKKSK